MHDDPIDLTPLDPDADPLAEERFVRAVMSRIAGRPKPYPVDVDPLWGAWSLARPVLIAASLVTIVAGVIVVRAASDASSRPLTVADAVGVPSVFGEQSALGGNGGPAR